MEGPEEYTGSNDHSQIVKGKRTKRQRPSSPFGVAVTSSSSSGGGGGGGGGGSGGDGRGGDIYSLISSPTTSGEISTSTVEDEDMANCLILLAQGGWPRHIEEDEVKIEKFNSRRFTEMVTTTTGKAGFYVYECKTCNRTFPSFQALGGHRASHKKPKAMVEEKKATVLPLDGGGSGGGGCGGTGRQFNKISPPLSEIANKSLNGNKQPKIHECSICGSEFSSGQALGGHMRRHRTATISQITINVNGLDTTTTTESSIEGDKPRSILPLDLNLPAPPEDDLQDPKFQFTSTQRHLVFSSPTLVDCHY
ncbi:unnamed protein product [Ilex paraguariensis]|uniref:C2H2-type domain-containing protein n=1 Tax=Ilex paraguariensis TaxID=185542 RepID=A0ABC8RB15_9AQUA